ncbi:MAG TPA: Rossmann-like and DUF2520 domain-containing protein [Bacteroidales bacterium]|nr:Rossmann-like and DUF2520 domain-containing protein [Bacteroidales bacterium]
MDKPHISFAGAGRVASGLCRELFRLGYPIDMVVSKTEKSGESLATSVSAVWSQNLDFPETTGLIIVAVPDNKLESVLSSVQCSSRTAVVHTAGSYGLDIFPGKIRKKGVFYPLQTFSPGRHLNFREIPFLLESDDESTREILHEIASAISRNVSFVDVEKRLMLHLSAIFVSNFTNYMFTAGSEIVRKAGFGLDILDPLIKETVSKALEMGPQRSQTGPAFRNDTVTIEKHLGLLSSTPELRELYKSVTQSIIDHYKNKNSDQF